MPDATGPIPRQSEPLRNEHLRQLWILSMNGQTPIWLAGHLQRIVLDELDLEDETGSAVSDRIFGERSRALTTEEGAEIRDRERRIREESPRWPWAGGSL